MRQQIVNYRDEDILKLIYTIDRAKYGSFNFFFRKCYITYAQHYIDEYCKPKIKLYCMAKEKDKIIVC
jgi:hypothetical protein